jgi:hypothetical protein
LIGSGRPNGPHAPSLSERYPARQRRPAPVRSGGLPIGVETREEIVLRRFMPVGVLLMALMFAACGSGKPALSSPDEIITKGIAATGEAKSLHLDVTVSGSVSIPDTGGTFDLAGTTVGGDFDIANDHARLTFKVPGLMGLSGEAIQIGTDSFIKTSLTGPKYTKSTVEDTGVALDPGAAIDQVGDFLDKEGVTAEKRDDVDCGDRDCYQVRLTIPSSVLNEAGGGAGVDLGQYLGDGLVLDLQFDRETLRLAQIATDIDAGEVGTFGLVITISGYDATVEVSPPPPDQVTEGGEGLSF